MEEAQWRNVIGGGRRRTSNNCDRVTPKAAPHQATSAAAASGRSGRSSTALGHRRRTTPPAPQRSPPLYFPAERSACVCGGSMSARWQRAAEAKPRVWRRCTGRIPAADGRLPRFVIQDVPEHLHDAVVAFMSTFFPRDEPICAHLKLWTDAQSLAELQELWRQTLRQRVALVAILEGEGGEGGDEQPRIVGCNVLAVLYKEDQGKPNPYQGFAMRAFLDALNYHNSVVDPFERFGAAEALVGLGLSIDPAFRGQGLGLELLRARFDLGRALGLRLTYTVFTAIQSQTLGARVGMDTLVEVPYKDYRDAGQPLLAGISFPPSMKLQARTID